MVESPVMVESLSDSVGQVEQGVSVLLVSLGSPPRIRTPNVAGLVRGFFDWNVFRTVAGPVGLGLEFTTCLKN